MQELVVLLNCLGKAKARIQPHLIATEAEECIEFFVEITGEVVDNVVVAGVFGQLHGGGGATHVHEDVGDVERGYRGQHFGVELSPGDVVHDVGSALHGTGGGQTAAGVDGEECFGQLTP